MNNKNGFLIILLLVLLSGLSIVVSKIYFEDADIATGLSVDEEQALLKVFPYGEELDFAVLKKYKSASGFVYPVVGKSDIGIDYRTMFKE